MKRIFIGGFVAGAVVYAWGAISHMVLPLGVVGIRVIDNEDAVVGAMQEGIPEAGLYFFPGLDMSKEQSETEHEAWEAKYREGPRGILVYHPEGENPLSPSNFLTQLIGDVVTALLAAFLVSLTAVAFRTRVLFVALLGLFGWLSISIPYWNWYGFPADFTIAQAVDEVIGWFLAGLVLAAIVRPSES